jgi:hypothetical protein
MLQPAKWLQFKHNCSVGMPDFVYKARMALSTVPIHSHAGAHHGW